MRTHLILIVLAACWCGIIIAAPAAASVDGPAGTAAHAVYAFFSAVCHQWDSHSFHLFGHKLPVCIRCTAIYFSFFAGIMLYPVLGRRLERRLGARSMLAAASAGMIIDAACAMLGISESTTVTRLVTGGIFGLLTAFVLTPVLEELIRSIRHAGIFLHHNQT
jgi:uncharacterized membrane protein